MSESEKKLERLTANLPVFLLAPSAADVRQITSKFGVRPLAKLLGVNSSSLVRAANGERGLSPALWSMILLLLDEHPMHRITQRREPEAQRMLLERGGRVLKVADDDPETA